MQLQCGVRQGDSLGSLISSHCLCRRRWKWPRLRHTLTMIVSSVAGSRGHHFQASPGRKMGLLSFGLELHLSKCRVHGSDAEVVAPVARELGGKQMH